jgi:hypothetical protein
VCCDYFQKPSVFLDVDTCRIIGVTYTLLLEFYDQILQQ